MFLFEYVSKQFVICDRLFQWQSFSVGDEAASPHIFFVWLAERQLREATIWRIMNERLLRQNLAQTCDDVVSASWSNWFLDREVENLIHPYFCCCYFLEDPQFRHLCLNMILVAMLCWDPSNHLYVKMIMTRAFIKFSLGPASKCIGEWLHNSMIIVLLTMCIIDHSNIWWKVALQRFIFQNHMPLAKHIELLRYYFVIKNNVYVFPFWIISWFIHCEY